MSSEEQKAKKRAYYLAHREEIKRKNKEYYYAHRERANECRRQHHVAHKEQQNKRAVAYRLAHLEHTKAKILEWQHSHRQYRSEQAKAENTRLRVCVLHEYGDRCQGCGETESRFLALSPLTEQARQQRRTTKSGIPLYKWLLARGCPKDLFVLLCLNCSHKKSPVSERRKREKATVITAYGGRCACCHNADPDCLSIDHSNNDGGKHRKVVTTGSIYFWLIDEGFPRDGFQLLCWNCNLGKHLNGGVCPHKEQ
jgi:hypothetical protein